MMEHFIVVTLMLVVMLIIIVGIPEVTMNDESSSSWADYTFSASNPNRAKSGWTLVKNEKQNTTNKEIETILDATNATESEIITYDYDAATNENKTFVENFTKLSENFTNLDPMPLPNTTLTTITPPPATTTFIQYVTTLPLSYPKTSTVPTTVPHTISTQTISQIPISTTPIPAKRHNLGCHMQEFGNLTEQEKRSRIAIVLTPVNKWSPKQLTRLCYALIHFASQYWSEYNGQRASFTNITFVKQSLEKVPKNPGPIQVVFFAKDGISGSLIDSPNLVDYIQHYVGALESETQSQISQFKVGETGDIWIDPMLLTGLITAFAALMAVCLTTAVVLVFWNRYRKRYYGQWVVNRTASTVHRPTSWSFENDAFWEDKQRMHAHALSVQPRVSVSHIQHTVSLDYDFVPMTILSGREREIY